MKYSQFSSKSKGNTAFYVIVAVCLLIIGGATWFALSNYNASVSEKENITQSSPKNDVEYKDKTSSYTENESEKAPSLDNQASQSVSDIPYTQTTEPVQEKTEFAMPLEGEILKHFSQSELQYSETYGDMRLHTGIDISCKEGATVLSCADGTVLSVEESAAFGTTVTVDHKNGITAKYSSLKNVTVKTNQQLSSGDALGIAATVPCECADQSHLHLEILKDGLPIDPFEIIK